MSNRDYSVLQMRPADEGDAEQPTNEDIYCEALADILHHITLPVMVGFYAPWGRNKRGLLKKIEEAMTQRSEEKEDKKGGGENKHSLFSFIWHIIFFYLPVSSSTSFERIRYIFINFDVWEYTGCDCTWAGLVSTLLDEIEEKNKILFSVVRAFGKEHPERGKTKEMKWVFKKRCKICFLGLLCVFISLILYMLLMEFEERDLWKDLGYMTAAVSAAVSGLPFILVIKNFLCTTKMKLQKDMDRKDLSSQLGFMNSVKEEVNTIINFLRFMAHKEGRDIRVVLKITNLDRCAPNKVVDVLDAMNMLLCNEDAPFISILAADPVMLEKCIQKSNRTYSNGYLYLDRLVSLPFFMPQMSQIAKRQFLKKILKNHLKKGSAVNPDKDSSAKSDKKEKGEIDEIQYISDYLSSEDFDACFPGNSIQIMRIVNTVLTILTMIKMGFQPKGGDKMNRKVREETMEQVIDWVVLANCWPCRLNWILQCEEDQRQQRSLMESQKRTSQDIGESAGGNQQRLLEVYVNHVSELKNKDINMLLELDGDPDVFKNFLQKKHFTVEHVPYFSDLLINLDFSLKRQFELLRGLNAITNENHVGPSHLEKR